MREPDTGPDTVRDVLQLCRIRDERLVSDRQGVVWNFPAGLIGRLEVECRIDGEGFQLALCDHWINPCDETVAAKAALAIPVTAEALGGSGKWIPRAPTSAPSARRRAVDAPAAPFYPFAANCSTFLR